MPPADNRPLPYRCISDTCTHIHSTKYSTCSTWVFKNCVIFEICCYKLLHNFVVVQTVVFLWLFLQFLVTSVLWALYVVCCKFSGSHAASFKQPLLSVNVSVCLSCALCVLATWMLNISETKRFRGAYRKVLSMTSRSYDVTIFKVVTFRN